MIDALECPYCHRYSFNGLLVLVGEAAACEVCVNASPLLYASRALLMSWVSEFDRRKPR